MTVKDEAANVAACLGPIRDRFAKIIVIDTGSSDDTCEILRDELDIDPWQRTLDWDTCFALAPARNEGFAALGTPWIMTLDADERLDPVELDALLALDDADLSDGIFARWTTYIPGRQPIDDYKLFLFRQPHRHMGLIHDTAQPSLRQVGASADWTDRAMLRHYPDIARIPEKHAVYYQRTGCALAREPDWLRYYWFTGYAAYRDGAMDLAGNELRRLHDGRPPLFPVESLNASMVLAAIHALRGERDKVLAVLDNALAYHRDVADDFEVRVNFRMASWLAEARNFADAGELRRIEPYAFPY
jgi:glycosyltransferase involved in cell wall biosynthesis